MLKDIRSHKKRVFSASTRRKKDEDNKNNQPLQQPELKDISNNELDVNPLDELNYMKEQVLHKKQRPKTSIN